MVWTGIWLVGFEVVIWWDREGLYRSESRNDSCCGLVFHDGVVFSIKGESEVELCRISRYLFL